MITPQTDKPFSFRENLEADFRVAFGSLSDRLYALHEALMCIGLNSESLEGKILGGGFDEFDNEIATRLDPLGNKYSEDEDVKYHVVRPGGFIVRTLDRLDSIEAKLDAIEKRLDQIR